ncbi:MAG: MlaD family protein [Solirubrobacteraceae bacterium]|nr:MlaD family protein [Solirubrobacteraceae bacterium]
MRLIAPRVHRRRPPYLVIGAIGVAVLALAVALIVTGSGLPGGRDGRRVHGIFGSTSGLRVGSPVRVAGVQVGRVDAVDPADDGAARVTLSLDDDAPPLREGTRLQVRPRVFLEGGYIVQVEPGPPDRPLLADGATVPLEDTSLSVSLPSVVGALDKDARTLLTSTVEELDAALARSGSARPLVRDLPPTLRDATRLTRALRGEEPGDLRELLRDAERLTATLAAGRDRLGGTLSGLRTVMGTLAGEDAELRAVLAELPRIARESPAALRAVRAALPDLDGLIADLGPTLRATPALLRAARGTLRQAELASRPSEIPALVRAARPLLDELPAFADAGRATLGQAVPLLRCLDERLIPGFTAKIEDGDHTTGHDVLQELLSMSVGLASSGGAFDANGAMVRLAPTAGTSVISAGAADGVGPFTATSGQAIQGARPVWYGTRGLPPFRPDLPCHEQPLPSLRTASAPAPRTRTARRTAPVPVPDDRADARSMVRRLQRALDRSGATTGKGVGGAGAATTGDAGEGR